MIFLLFFFIFNITYISTSVFILRLCYEWANCWFQNNGGQSKSGSTGKLSHLGKGFVIEGHKIWDWWLIYVIRTSQCNCDDYTLFWKSNFPYNYMWMLLLLFFFVIIVESLVHIQWKDECGKCHTSCIKPCTWVWRWRCQRRSNGKEACSLFLKSNNFIKCL